MRADSLGLAALLAMLLVATAAGARADPPEDEAHRLDRSQTRDLNDQALQRLTPPPPAPMLAAPRPIPTRAATLPAPPAPAASPEEIALRAREERAITAWRARMAACRAGDRKSCDRR